MFKCYGTRLTMSGCQEYQILEVSICLQGVGVSECQFGRFGANETVDKMLIEGAPSAPSFLLFFLFSAFLPQSVAAPPQSLRPLSQFPRRFIVQGGRVRLSLLLLGYNSPPSLLTSVVEYDLTPYICV